MKLEHARLTSRVCLLVLGLGGSSALGQTCADGEPTTLGLVIELGGACPSGPGPLPNTTCRWLEVHCTGLAPLTVQLRITEPPVGVPIRGTVVFGTGGSGTGFYGTGADGQALFTGLSAMGFRVVDRAWPSPGGWTTAEAGLRRESCRYATLLTWIHQNVHTSGAFCASGNSGGSAEVGYALTTWSRGDILDLAVPTSGPAVARLDYVCPVVPPAEWVSLCSTIVPAGSLSCPSGWDCSIAGNGVCFQCSSSPTAADLRADSVVHVNALLHYPNTRCHFLYGELDCGVSPAVGLTWSTNVTSAKVIEFVPNTPHGMSSTSEGRAAILRAIDQGTPPASTMTICPGDGSAIPCPCGNDGASGHGCASSSFAEGALLAAAGTSSVTGDTVVLRSSSLTGQSCVFFQGDAQMAPVVIDDGLGCVTGMVIRLGTKRVAGGASSFPQAGDPLISVRGQISGAGGTRYSQAFYRNAVAAFCPPATSNRTNGVALVWGL